MLTFKECSNTQTFLNSDSVNVTQTGFISYSTAFHVIQQTKTKVPMPNNIYKYYMHGIYIYIYIAAATRVQIYEIRCNSGENPINAEGK